jgi:hypothetical protein
MRMPRVVLAAILLVVAALEPAASESWRTYRNARFGTSASYPADVFTPGEEPANGDGLTFTSPDGARLLIFGQNNALGETPSSFQKRLVSEAPNDYSSVTYRKLDARSVTLSGLRGDMVYYERYVFSVPPGTIHAAIITYPVALKGRFDPLVSRISRSLTAPKG